MIILHFLILALVLGISLGYINLLSQKGYEIAERITFLGLIVLLYSMGLDIGSNPNIINNLNNLGLNALVLAIASIVGSIVLAIFIQNILIKEN